MKTIIIQIGNSDDKLSQKEWAMYVKAVDNTIESLSEQIHFRGFSQGDAPWQNACWVCACEDVVSANHIRECVRMIRLNYRQDSVAWCVGETEFI